MLLDGRRVAEVSGGRSPLTVRIRRAGRRVTVSALSGDGRVLAKAAAEVRRLKAGKRGVSQGGGIGTSGRVWAG